MGGVVPICYFCGAFNRGQTKTEQGTEGAKGNGILDGAKEKGAQILDGAKEKGAQLLAWAKETGPEALQWVKENGVEAMDWWKENGAQILAGAQVVRAAIAIGANR